MPDHNDPDHAPGSTVGETVAGAVAVMLTLAVLAVAGFVLLFPVLIGDF